MKKIIFVLSALLLAIAGGIFANVSFDMPVLPAAGIFFSASILMPDIPGITQTLFTAPGGIAAAFQFNMTYIPQFLQWNDGGNPLTSLRIESQEDGIIHDYVAASIAAVNGYQIPGAQPANNVVIRLANGEIKNRNVTISGVTSAVGAININGSSDKTGSHLLKFNAAAILAGNLTTFKDFTALFVPTMGAGDTVEILFRDGHRQVFNAAELTALSAMYQDTAAIIVNNINAYIKEAVFNCALATPAYILSVKS